MHRPPSHLQRGSLYVIPRRQLSAVQDSIPAAHTPKTKKTKSVLEQEQRLLQEQQEKALRRSVQQWIRNRHSAPSGGQTLVRELLAMKRQARAMAEGRATHDQQLTQLKISTTCLGQFTRWYFGSDLPLRTFTEWMYDCPFLQSGEVPGIAKRHQGMRFEELEHAAQRKYRYRPRAYLRVILLNLLESQLTRALTRSQTRYPHIHPVFVQNSVAHMKYAVMIHMEDYEAIAFYPESVLNKKLAFRTARKKDYINKPPRKYRQKYLL